MPTESPQVRRRQLQYIWPMPDRTGLHLRVPAPVGSACGGPVRPEPAAGAALIPIQLDLTTQSQHLETRCLEDFMPPTGLPRMDETPSGHAKRAPMIANGLVRGALPALGQPKTPATIPHSHRRGKEFRHRSFHAGGQAAAFLIRAGLLVVWLQLSVPGFRPVLARGWHAPRLLSGVCS